VSAISPGPVSLTRLTIRGRTAGKPPLWYHRRARRRGRFHAMPNIKQQKKRVRTASEERLENLRYSSTIKTLTKRLETAASESDAEQLAAEHGELVRTIDRARSSGALHRNAAARKKSQAAKIASRSGS
jgi:small subunit ribosomal protein S20